MLPVRADPGFGSTVYAIDPLPVPLLDVWIQLWLAVADQAQFWNAAIETFPLAPADDSVPLFNGFNE